MNVGDYIRKEGIIAKVKKCCNNKDVWYFSYDLANGCEVGATLTKSYKSSPQIIDLIEVGDFITYKQGNFYWNVFEQVSARYNRENQMTDLIVDNKPLNTVEILTVITHEQMKAMQYRVEE